MSDSEQLEGLELSPSGREANLAVPHRFRVGDLVEVTVQDWHGGGACSCGKARLWVVKCGQDSDGKPLYWLATTPRHKWEHIIVACHPRNGDDGFQTRNDDPGDGTSLGQRIFYRVVGGFPEDALTKIEVNEALREGYARLRPQPEWLGPIDILDSRQPEELGFADFEDLFKLWCVPRDTPAQQAAFERWAKTDRTKAGLLALEHWADVPGPETWLSTWSIQPLYMDFYYYVAEEGSSDHPRDQKMLLPSPVYQRLRRQEEDRITRKYSTMAEFRDDFRRAYRQAVEAGWKPPKKDNI